MAVSQKNRHSDASFYRGAFRWMGVGIEFCLVVGAFCVIGYFLDRWEGTRPGWMIVGFFVGFGLMLYSLIKRAKSSQDQMDADDRDQDDG